MAEVAKDGAFRVGMAAGASVLLAIAWGLLCAAAVVALSSQVGTSAALALVAAPHALAGIALLLSAKRGLHHGHQ